MGNVDHRALKPYAVSELHTHLHAQLRIKLDNGSSKKKTFVFGNRTPTAIADVTARCLWVCDLNNSKYSKFQRLRHASISFWDIYAV
jgi:hypothetical protein